MTPEIHNLFNGIPPVLAEEQISAVGAGRGARIERIVSGGQATPAGEWYDQQSDEWVILLSGSAGLSFDGDGEPVILTPGDYLLIPAGCRHRVEWTAPEMKTVWLAVHFDENTPPGAP